MKYLLAIFLLSFSCMASDISDFAHKVITENFVKTQKDSKELDEFGKWFKNTYDAAQHDDDNIDLKKFLDRKLLEVIPQLISKEQLEKKLPKLKKIIYILYLYKVNHQDIPVYLHRIPQSALDELDEIIADGFTWEKLNNFFLDKVEKHGKEIDELKEELQTK